MQRFIARGARLLVVCGLGLSGMSAVGGDAIQLPPQREAFVAPGGRFELVVASVDGWKTPRSSAQLRALGAGTPTVLWSLPLPHEYRPRHVLVGRDGRALLVDEWIHVASRFALVLLDPTGRTVARHDFETVRRAIGLPAAQVAAAARLGAWVAVPPRLDASGEKVEIGAAGRTLVVDLRDGSLALRPPP